MQRWLIVWLAVLSGIALYLPELFSAIGALVPGNLGYASGRDPFLVLQPALPFLFAVTMFGVGWLLPAEQLAQLQGTWKDVVMGTAVQYTSMPLLGYVAGRLLNLPEGLLVGTVMVGCVPGAMASNVLTLAARGHVAYSICLTTLATLASPIVVPLWMQFLLRETRAFPTASVMWQLVWMVVMPTVLGQVCSRLARSWGRRAAPFWSFLANLTILWIIATVVAQNRDRLGAVPMQLLMALLIINMGGYAAGWTAGRLGGLSTPMRRALTLEVGMQNAGLGTVLVQSVFPDLPQAQIPTATYTFGCMLTGTILATWWGWDTMRGGPR